MTHTGAFFRIFIEGTANPNERKPVMFCGKILFPTVSKLFSLASYQVRHSDFDTSYFMSSLSAARYQVFGEREKIKAADTFSLVLCRGEALYFSIFSVYGELLKNSHTFSPDVYNDCRELSIRSFSLFDRIYNADDRKVFFSKREEILADICAFRTSARHMRFAALTRCGSISRALPEIEYISKSDIVCSRAERLLISYVRLMAVLGKY